MRKIVVTAAVLYLVALGFAVRDLSVRAGTRRITGWSNKEFGGAVVASVSPGYEVLRPGDRIVTIEGRKPRPIDLGPGFC